MFRNLLQLNRQKLYAFIKHNGIFYLTGLLLLFGMKYFYSRANVNHLTWILAPTVWWVQTLSGVPFHFVPYEGYVNHTYQFVIAASCSGMQFMIIAIATLLFPFIPKINTKQKKIWWTIFILPVSYALTILVNIIRIFLSLYLPVIITQWMMHFHQKSLPDGFLTPARLHTIIGSFVYFTSLFFIYHLTGLLTRQSFHKILPPMFFYLALVLGVPLLTQSWQKQEKQFMEYTLLVVFVCLTVIFLYQIWSLLWKTFSKHFRKSGRTKPYF